MAFDTEFITTSEAVTNAISEDASNFDLALIDRNIIMAQRKYILPKLGYDLFTTLQTEVEASSLTAENTVIMDSFIKMALANYLFYEEFYNIYYDTSTGGINLATGETTSTASVSEAKSRRDNFLSIGDQWMRHMDDYIKKNQETNTSYVDYLPETTSINSSNNIF